MNNTKKDAKTDPKAKGIDVEAYADKANSSARHFVALLGEAIIKLPRIREFTQEAADKKDSVNKDAFVIPNNTG